ncbi:MAG: TIM barrel protein [Bauldia sp.]|nr:TIM barrel protein [Bauldia sp.]
MPRLSANLGFLWPDRPLLERIDAAGRAGFKAVELHYPYDVPAAEVAAACRRNDVALLGINTNIGSGADPHVGLAAVPGRETDFAILFEQALDYAVAAGGTAIHVMAGRVTETDHEAGGETLVANLTAAAPKAAAHDLTLLIEPINPFDIPGYFYSRIEQGAAIQDRVGAPNLRLMFDAYHIGRVGDDPFAALDRYLDRVGHIQIAAVPSRAEPDEGTLDYRALLRRIDEVGYTGWVGAEYKPRAGTDEGLGWMATLGLAA